MNTKEAIEINEKNFLRLNTIDHILKCINYKDINENELVRTLVKEMINTISESPMISSKMIKDLLIDVKGEV